MADIVAADVVYAEQAGTRQIVGDSRVSSMYSVTFGDASDDYPTGGIPITKASIGLANNIESVEIIDASSGDGFVYKYDLTNDKIRIYQGDNDAVADGALIEFINTTDVPAETTLIMKFTGW